MLIQYDCWESPTAAEVAAAISDNPLLCAWQGYVPGWGRPYGGGWSAQAARAVMDAGLGYLPLLVPNSGDAAQTPRTAQGWDEAVIFAAHHVASGGGQLTILGLNVEAPWSAADMAGWRAAALAFAAACQRAGVDSFPYGSPSFLASLAGSRDSPTGIYCGEWPNGASAPYPLPTTPDTIPGIPDSEWAGSNQRVWQYQGGHQVSGLSMNVDSSVAGVGVKYCRKIVAPTPQPDPAPTSTALGPGTYTVTAGATIVIN